MNLKNRLLLPALIAALGLIPADPAMAQTLTTLHSFGPAGYYQVQTNSEGMNPSAGLTISGDRLYGTASGGGPMGGGTIFALKTNGSSFTVLHSFNIFSANNGAGPRGWLAFVGGTLYGTTAGPVGYSGVPSIFAVRTNGSGLTFLHLWNILNAGSPLAGVALSSNTLYTTTYSSLYKVDTNGAAFSDMFDLGGSSGVNAIGGVIVSGNALYGTCASGGLPGSGAGTVYRIGTDGTYFTVLHSFSTNGDGFAPSAALTLSSNTLYGTTPGAFVNDAASTYYGTVFKINADGSGFAVLHRFNAEDGGGSPGSLTLSGNTLFGVSSGQLSPFPAGPGNGTIFALNTDGTGFTNLYSFSPTAYGNTNSDGAGPNGGLVLSGNTLYGTTGAGGSFGNGTVFSITLPVIQPQLTITPAGTNVILTWPSTPVGFTLESATNLASPVWTTNLPAPVLVNGQNTVTNPIVGSKQFFRLIQ